MQIERRRTDRIRLTIPVRVHGEDSAGRRLRVDGRTVVLNRHGARIQVLHLVSADHNLCQALMGKNVTLVNAMTQREAEFRIVGPTSPPTPERSEWAFECVDANSNIWGINFPSLAPGGETQAEALMECRVCHTVALVHLSLAEADVLETSGILIKHCEACENNQPWGYVEKQLTLNGPSGEAQMIAEVASAQGANRRKHQRVPIRLPILVRDYYGGVEITKTENVSKGGICFESGKPYLIGQGLMVACPYDGTDACIEVAGKIVRKIDIEGSTSKVYGVRYGPMG